MAKNPPANAEDFGSTWQPAPVFLPGESHGRRSLAGCSPWGSQRVGHDSVTKTTTNIKHYVSFRVQPTDSILVHTAK